MVETFYLKTLFEVERINTRKIFQTLIREEVNRFFGDGFMVDLNGRLNDLQDVIVNAILHRVLNIKGKCRDGDSIRYQCVEDAYQILRSLELNIILDVDVKVQDEEKVVKIIKRYL